MKHHPAVEDPAIRPAVGRLDILSLGQPAQSDEDELARLQRLVERQFRTGMTMASLLKARPPGKQDGKRVDFVSRVPKARWTTRPAARPTAKHPSAWWTTSGQPATPLVAPIGYDCQSLARSVKEQVGVLVRGLKGADLENVIASVADEQRRTRAFRPVFITDQPELSVFLRRGFAVEYVRPDRGFDQVLQAERWEHHKDFHTRKWGLTRIIDRDNARAIDRDYAAVATISQHNADMSRACHRDRFAWMAETLRIAIATERYDVAGDLGEHLLTAFDKIPGGTQLAAAKALCRKFLAFGETDLLQRFLFKIHTRISSDDFLFTLFSVNCTGSETFVGDMAHLPSGKLNSYYISKRLRPPGDQMLPSFLDKTETAAPDSNFLLANLFALRQHAELYRLFANRGLAHTAQAQIKRISFAGDNILSTMTFEKPAATRHQAEMVSVIMSSHNSSATIAYAARSILEQTYSNIELLICDDNPETGSLDALGDLRADPRLRVFTSNAPQGTYNIRNNLIPLARGSIITFHDSDDIAFPNRIETQVEHLKETGAAAVCGLWYRVGKSGDFVFSTDHAVSRLAVVSLMASKSIFETAGPYRSARFGADTEYFESLKQRFGPGAIPTLRVPLLFGLSSETSLTRRAGMEASEDGYRSPARRAYASASARRRLVSWESNDGQLFEQRLADLNVLMAKSGVVEGADS